MFSAFKIFENQGKVSYNFNGVMFSADRKENENGHSYFYHNHFNEMSVWYFDADAAAFEGKQDEKIY